VSEATAKARTANLLTGDFAACALLILAGFHTVLTTQSEEERSLKQCKKKPNKCTQSSRGTTCETTTTTRRQAEGNLLKDGAVEAAAHLCTRASKCLRGSTLHQDEVKKCKAHVHTRNSFLMHLKKNDGITRGCSVCLTARSREQRCRVRGLFHASLLLALAKQTPAR
jgi:hypothetical protein